jgi:hypothetical protein
MGNDGAPRTGAACPVNALRADDRVRFNGERSKEENRSQRRVDSCLHEMYPSSYLPS